MDGHEIYYGHVKHLRYKNEIHFNGFFIEYYIKWSMNVELPHNQ